MIIVAIDPGLANLGLGVYNTYYNEKGECIINKVLVCVTLHIYRFCNDFDCTYKAVNNVNTTTNHILHVIHHYKTWFDIADYIIMEHQSPKISTSKVDEIFSSLFKSRLYHLNIYLMAKYYNYESLYTSTDPEQRREIRKKQSIKLAKESGLFDDYINELTDHITDTFLFAQYFCLTSQKKSKYFLNDGDVENSV